MQTFYFSFCIFSILADSSNQLCFVGSHMPVSRYTSIPDRHLWIWIYPWISTQNLWIWIWMGNFISTATLEIRRPRRPADTQARQLLRTASSTSIDVRRTRLSTVGDRAFPVAAAHLWNSLPSHVFAAPSLSIFYCRLKSHLFSLSYPAFWLFCHLYSHFGHYNCYYI